MHTGQPFSKTIEQLNQCKSAREWDWIRIENNIKYKQYDVLMPEVGFEQWKKLVNDIFGARDDDI